MSVSKGVLSVERQLFITAEGQHETPEEHLSAEMVPSGYASQRLKETHKHCHQIHLCNMRGGLHEVKGHS